MITEKDVITTVKLCMKELRKKKYELNRSEIIRKRSYWRF